jgi:hypothetical protein
MADPVLDLNTLFTRAIVRIDSAPYELRNLGELPIAHETRFDRQADQINALLAADSLTEEQDAEMSRLLDARCRAVLIAPDEVHRRLTDRQRSQILQVFFRPQPPTPSASEPMVAAVAGDPAETPAVSDGLTGAN